MGVGCQALGREHADRRAQRNFSVKDQEQIVLDTVESYRTSMAASPG